MLLGGASPVGVQRGEYSLATGPKAVRRLEILHDIYGPFGKRILLRAGLKAGMKVADFGCGVGMVSKMMAEIVGPTGKLVGIDASAAQWNRRETAAARQACTTRPLSPPTRPIRN